MKVLKGKNVVVHEGDLKRREEANKNYLLKLTNDNLLFNYKVEAGRYHGRDIPVDAHGGWETPVCQIRGHFLGHWLSAAAFQYDQSGDAELKVKADLIITEHIEMQQLIASGLKKDRKSTRLNSSHVAISYAVFCLKKER